MKITFSVNVYDQNGDIIEKGVYLQLDGVSIKVANTIKEYREFVNILDTITDELCDEEYQKILC